MSAHDDERLLQQLGAYARSEEARAAESAARAAVDPERVAQHILQRQRRPSQLDLSRGVASRVRAWPGLMFGAALAAGVGLVLLSSDPHSRDAAEGSATVAAGYELSLVSARAEWRAPGESEGRDSLAGGGPAILLLRPASATDQELAVGVWHFVASELHALNVDLQRDASGSIRIGFDVPAAAGAIVVVLAARDRLIGAGEVLARDPAERGPDFRRWTLPIQPLQ